MKIICFILGYLTIRLGYKLIKSGVTGEFKFSTSLSSFKADLASVSPGLLFVLLGVILIGYAMSEDKSVDVTTKSKNSVPSETSLESGSNSEDVARDAELEARLRKRIEQDSIQATLSPVSDARQYRDSIEKLNKSLNNVIAERDEVREQWATYSAQMKVLKRPPATVITMDSGSEKEISQLQGKVDSLLRILKTVKDSIK